MAWHTGRYSQRHLQQTMTMVLVSADTLLADLTKKGLSIKGELGGAANKMDDMGTQDPGVPHMPLSTI